MSFSEIKEWLEFLSYAAAIVGIPLAIYVYYQGQIKERKIRELEVLFTSHSLYVDYLKICLEHPELDVYHFNTTGLKGNEKLKKEQIVSEILFAYLESTYLYYKDLSDDVRDKRWIGWKNYIIELSENEHFRSAWDTSGNQWDKDFINFMNGIIKKRK